MIRIALDVTGGDHAPGACIEGARAALMEHMELSLTLLGPAGEVAAGISDWEEGLLSRTRVLDAPEMISTDEHPTTAIKKKKNSAIVLGLNQVRNSEADAFISAGSSGALLAGAQLIVGRVPGVMRTPLASLMPTARGNSLFLDCGANMDAKPEWLCQYARMGSIYMELVEGYESPGVYLANVGPEEEKGNALVQSAHALLKDAEDINYEGFIEFRDIPQGAADIVVADAFTGNAIIKTYEGAGKVLIASVKDVLSHSVLTRLGALMIMGPLRDRLSRFDASRSGGALLLGLRGPVIKCHGNADASEISTSIAKAVRFVREDVTGHIAAKLSKE